MEILSVVFDCKEWEAQGKKSQDRGPRPSTGGWINIYEGPLLDVPVGAFGTEISVKGEAIKTRRPYIPQQTIGGNFAAKFQNTNSSQDASDYVPSQAGGGNNLSVNASSIPVKSNPRLHSASRVSLGKAAPHSPTSKALPSPRKEKFPPSPRKPENSSRQSSNTVMSNNNNVNSGSKVPIGKGSEHKVNATPRSEGQAAIVEKNGFDDSDDENMAETTNAADGGFNDDLDDDLDDVEEEVDAHGNQSNVQNSNHSRGPAGSGGKGVRRKSEAYVVPPGAKAIPIKVFEVEF